MPSMVERMSLALSPVLCGVAATSTLGAGSSLHALRDQRFPYTVGDAIGRHPSELLAIQVLVVVALIATTLASSSLVVSLDRVPAKKKTDGMVLGVTGSALLMVYVGCVAIVFECHLLLENVMGPLPWETALAQVFDLIGCVLPLVPWVGFMGTRLDRLEASFRARRPAASPSMKGGPEGTSDPQASNRSEAAASTDPLAMGEAKAETWFVAEPPQARARRDVPLGGPPEGTIEGIVSALSKRIADLEGGQDAKPRSP